MEFEQQNTAEELLTELKKRIDPHFEGFYIAVQEGKIVALIKDKEYFEEVIQQLDKTKPIYCTQYFR